MVLEGSGAPVDDVARIAALRAGEEGSFRDLVMRYHAALVRLARVSMGSQAAAEEVASNTWRVVIRDIGGFDGRSSLKVWIFGIALNEVHAVHRRIVVPPDRAWDRAAPAVHPDRFVPDGQRWAGHWCAPPVPWTGLPTELLIGPETVAAVMSVIDELPARTREVVILRDVEDWTAAEVCALLEISEADHSALLHEGRSRVRARLEELFDGQPWRT